MADKDYTYSDVSSHSTKKDLLVVIHDKVYNASSFVDEHPYVLPLWSSGSDSVSSPQPSHTFGFRGLFGNVGYTPALDNTFLIAAIE